MEYKNVRVFVPESGKQALAMVRGLKELGCHVTVACKSKLNACYASKLPDKKILFEHLFESEDETLKFYLEQVKSDNYDVLMPIGEKSTSIVNSHEDEFKRYIKVACAPMKAYIQVFNKQNTFDKAIEIGTPCPYTRHSKQAIEDYLSKAHFPLIIKPRQGVGSIGFHKFKTESELREYLVKPDFNIDDYVLQEFVEFDHRIGTLVFMDVQGNVCTSYNTDVLRQYPPDAGSAILIKTTQAPEIQEKFIHLLKELHGQGYCAGCFMIEKRTGQPKLLEINGRIPATVKLAYMCGFNIAKQMLEMTYGEVVTQYPYYTGKDMYVRHFDTDLAWFLKSKDRFSSKPSWFSWKDTCDVLYSKDDPWPFWSNLWNNVLMYREKIKLKQH
jgi:predicted ATP-grasp superfamily ATP-dependent carboligase